MTSRSRRGKTVYERIADTQNAIAVTEEKLTQLRKHLATLNTEKDDLEMHQLFEFIRSNGITLEQAKALMKEQ